MNDRICFILMFLFIGCIVKAGPISIQKNDSIKKDSLHYALNDTTIALDEVVIKEQKKFFRWEGNEMLIDVANTDLGDEMDIATMFRRIPGMRVGSDRIEIIGYKPPVYYINDKKVINFYEVEMLSVKDMQSIRLLLSPGVQYDSDGAPVILIKTKKRNDGIIVQIRPSLSYSKKLSHNEDFNLTVHRKYIDVFGMYRYNNSYTYSDSRNFTEIKSDTFWKSFQPRIENRRYYAHTCQIGMNYNRVKYSFGIKYDGTFNQIDQNEREDFELLNNAHADNLTLMKAQRVMKSNTKNHHANIFYWLTFSDYWKIKMNGDYINKRNFGNNINCNESSNKLDSLGYDVKSMWNVIAFQLSLNYYRKKIGNFALGGNISMVNGYSETQYDDVIYQTGKTKLSENRYSFFLSYSNSWKQWTLQAGLRYNWYATTSENVNTSSLHKEHYPDWQPNISLAYNTTLIKQYLSYSMSITRPQYADLNANLYYVNPFTYRKGNLDLKSSKEHSLNYILFWKYLYVNLGYTYVKNMIMFDSDLYQENSYATISYKGNRDLTHIVTAVLNFRYPIRFWEPSLSLFCHKTFYRYLHFDRAYKSGFPCIWAEWDNLFKLTPTCRLSINYQQDLKGELYNIICYPRSVINVQLQKSFLKDQLQLAIGCDDLLNGGNLKGTTRFKAIYQNMTIKKNSRKFYFKLVYRFNHSLSKNKYKGENAADEELNRLEQNAGE